LEKDEKDQLLATISKVQWCRESQDRKVWVEDDQQVYSLKFGYTVLNKED